METNFSEQEIRVIIESLSCYASHIKTYSNLKQSEKSDKLRAVHFIKSVLSDYLKSQRT